MKKFLGLLLLTPLACSAASFFDFEADVGGSAYARGADGLWVQDGFSHKVDLTAPAVEGGVAIEPLSWLTIHADYAWLGTIHSRGLATTDANYNTAARTWRTPMPLATFQGSGHDQGFLFTLEPHVDYGRWRVGVEAGPYYHRATWSADAQNQVNYIGQAPGSSHFESTSGWHLGYVAGLSVSYRDFTLRYQFFHNGPKAGDPAPPIWKNTHVLTLGYRF
jgi:hypothetical protein